MQKKSYMYHCPACKTSIEIPHGPLSAVRVSCKACRRRLRSSGLTPAQWNELTEAEQQRVYEIPWGELVESKRLFNMLLIVLCIVLCAATRIAPVLATFDADPLILLACAAVYFVIYEYDTAKKFRQTGEKNMKFLKAASAETAEPTEQA